MPPIIYEEEGEENMATNLRVGLKKMQCKCLSESIMVGHLFAKKPYINILCPKPISAIVHHQSLQPLLQASTLCRTKESSQLKGPLTLDQRGPPLVWLNSVMTPLSVWLMSLHVPSALCPQSGRDNLTNEADFLLYREGDSCEHGDTLFDDLTGLGGLR